MQDNAEDCIRNAQKECTRLLQVLRLSVSDTISALQSSALSVCRNAGLFGLRFHDLRHTAATRLIRAGMPLNEVDKILGHTQANTTLRYVSATTETTERAARLLNEFNI